MDRGMSSIIIVKLKWKTKEIENTEVIGIRLKNFIRCLSLFGNLEYEEILNKNSFQIL